MAEDSASWSLALWLRARGGLSGDGSMGGFLLQDWQDKGWEGEKLEFRKWKKDSWGSKWGSDW